MDGSGSANLTITRCVLFSAPLFPRVLMNAALHNSDPLSRVARSAIACDAERPLQGSELCDDSCIRGEGIVHLRDEAVHGAAVTGT